MMYGQPNFRSPFYKYKYPDYIIPPTYPNPMSKINYNKKNVDHFNEQVNKVTPNEKKEETKNIRSADSEIFEIFGLKLHFDDILIICLLFFLYLEGVKDEWLFISLILLLLS